MEVVLGYLRMIGRRLFDVGSGVTLSFPTPPGDGFSASDTTKADAQTASVSHMTGWDILGSPTTFAVRIAMSAHMAGSNSDRFLHAARSAQATIDAKRTVPSIPTFDTSMAKKLDGRLLPSPTPRPNVCARRSKENESADDRAKKEDESIFPVTRSSA